MNVHNIHKYAHPFVHQFLNMEFVRWLQNIELLGLHQKFLYFFKWLSKSNLLGRNQTTSTKVLADFKYLSLSRSLSLIENAMHDWLTVFESQNNT
jgi:hypothetical protein